MLARVTRSGRLDRRFGKDGRRVLLPRGGSPSHVAWIGRAPGRRGLVAYSVPYHDRWVVVRLLADERIDRGYGTDGVARDPRGGIAGTLVARDRWGVRRYTAALTPRTAPGTLPSSGSPYGLAIDARGRAWVGFDGGRVARVRRDGNPDLRWGPRGRSRPIATRDTLITSAVADLGGGRVGLAGLVYRDHDIREAYGLAKMWVARLR